MTSDQVREMIRRELTPEGVEAAHARWSRAARYATGLAEMTKFSDVVLPFIQAYIEETPDLLDAAFAAATAAGAGPAMQPIFDAALKYWQEPADLVPDDLGMLGLLDDAYLSLRLLESVSAVQRAKTGRPLLSIDLEEINHRARQLLGEPIATRLDELVEKTLCTPPLRDSAEMLAAAPVLSFPPDSVGEDSYRRLSQTSSFELPSLATDPLRSGQPLRSL
jgi:uncharacterized membrane protein YkvA (DUF1232 family)